MPSPSPLRVMSFNVRYDTAKDGPNRWRRRREAAFEVARAFAPDVLALQELLPRQLDDWTEALPGYQRAVMGREGPEDGEAVALFVREGAYRIRRSGGFWLSETPDEPSLGWDAMLPRVAAWAELEGRGTRLFAVVTHLDHLGPESRARGAAQIKAWLAAQGATSAVLAGDFNAAPDGPAYEIFTGPEAPALVDTWRALHDVEPGPTYHDWGAPHVPVRIDWIFASEDWRVLEAAVDRSRPGDVWPSDHYPVTAVLG